MSGASVQRGPGSTHSRSPSRQRFSKPFNWYPSGKSALGPAGRRAPPQHEQARREARAEPEKDDRAERNEPVVGIDQENENPERDKRKRADLQQPQARRAMRARLRGHAVLQRQSFVRRLQATQQIPHPAQVESEEQRSDHDRPDIRL